jgi:preprotein translocase subunit SecG
MFGFFLTLLVVIGIFLSVVILLQAGKGGGLAAMGGGGGTMTEGVLGGRQASTFLVRATWTAGAAFMILSLILAILSSRQGGTGSILADEFGTVPTAPAPVLPGAEPLPGGGAAPQPLPDGGAIPDGLGALGNGGEGGFPASPWNPCLPLTPPR